MTISLRDQLLGLGYKPAPKPERKPEHKPAPGKPPLAEQRRGGKPAHAENRPRNQAPHKPVPRANDAQKRSQQKPRTREDIDLAKAYAIRAQREKDERIEAERLKQEEARKRREAKAALAELIAGKGLNAADAEHVRHFEYGGKIKRIHVTADQLKALNAGELGVLQQDGRYLLVSAELLAQAEAIFAPAVALKVDPNATAEADPYADPQYQVPDDLVW
ncbi:DUF2058 domain-containing protein [Thermomonas carbonis]|uniref:DUF2058 family protein n=1 Tax=Thermomonas carbonis TaxID=1463158 RepID=A0A7G9SNT9_9GAMM|nr:DUF2058 family protein [Thermomonas carbonis]QNN69514.1 DUF2058 family protein [Thermomonas carbonis]GHB93589.1 hypothetical protein GCM10010080_00700 [Thermomonas carbonis]